MSEREFKYAELLRRFENLIRRGKIAELDVEAARVRVQVADNVTDWLPWLTLRAGHDRTWFPPSVGEQVLLLSESGDFNNGVALTGLYSTAHPKPADADTITLTEWADGATVTYDRGAHRYVVDIPAAGEILFKIGRTTLSLTDALTTLTSPQVAGVKS